MHITNSKEKKWLQNYIECSIYKEHFNTENKMHILNLLTYAEELEKFISNKFPGTKRFSLEGAETLIPMLHEAMYYAGNLNVSKIICSMAHRGRLNVLVNIFGKKERYLFKEFSNLYYDKNKSGDVKYHLGYQNTINVNNNIIDIILKCNPSHLEIINSVVIGSARAYIDLMEIKNSNKILPIIIHGDAAITGQGIVQETLNMSQVQGYEVGGTIHIVINNQIGFTTSQKKYLQSSRYCTDIAKMIDSPIFHVNADYPECAILIIKMALNFRFLFKKDVFIDFVCYRRHGHNEVDDPSVTQPILYQKIKKHTPVPKVYNDYLVMNKIVMPDYIEKIKSRNKNKLEKEYEYSTKTKMYYDNTNEIYNNITCTQQLIDFKKIKKIASEINTIPHEINVHPLVKKIYDNRYNMALNKIPWDWGAAENLAYATLVSQGISCRLSGEDISRGTFFHRHAIIHDQKNGSIYIPIQHIQNKKGKFYIWDSVLSEESVLAFEYGYSTTNNSMLTVWEAQFGDFSNVAQVVIDQFISSGEQKWGYKCGLVMLLPHGYEGQGPEHSSARLERYLQLSAENNIQICIPTTAAQIYHLLRRQAFQINKTPLIIMSPKSNLRNPLTFSSFENIINGKFTEIIDEIDDIEMSELKRIIFCSGKIYYDLLEKRREIKKKYVVILRLEQLYPFPKSLILQILKKYSHISDFIWCQEEPINQGAWNYIQHYFRNILAINSSLKYIGRKASASPAVGNLHSHKKQQQKIINDALNIYS